VAGHLSWQGMSMLVQAVAQFGVTAVLARLLSPEDFGVIAAANIAITFMQVIAEGGVGSAIVQRSDLTPAFISAAMTVALMVGAGCYAVLVICAFPFQAFFAMPGLGVVVLALGLSSLVSGTCSVLEGLLQRNMGFGSLFRVNLVTSTAGYAVPAIGLALAGAGVWSLVAAALGRVTVKFLMLARLAPMSIRPRWEHFGHQGSCPFRFWPDAGPLLVMVVGAGSAVSRRALLRSGPARAILSG
jgi:O-antigen/teichoic acid export membrane protein